jgi:manganese/zinc/iron transport system substrate-binding protein
VVTTVTMISDLVRRVAEDTVEVQELMGPGVDPHVYKPKASDRGKLDRADLILYNGLHLEGTMVHTLEDNPKARAVTGGMPREQLLYSENQPDPHVWFDVGLWTHALAVVEEELAKLVPREAGRYRQNAAAYREELNGLHRQVKSDLAAIPKEQRVLITSHDAFRYFGRAYDVEVKGLQGISTADEAGLKEIRQLVDFAVRRQIKALFPETSVSADGLNKIIEQCRAKGHEVRLADGQLYSDAMDAPGTPGGTYPGMIRHNVELILRSLK